MTVHPFEARECPEIPDDKLKLTGDIITAVNGFAYSGGNLDTIVFTVRWLLANPDRATELIDD